jgi:hypothetical protein
MWAWLGTAGTFLAVLAILYWRLRKLQIEGEEARTEAVQEKLDRADALFRDGQREERRGDEEEAAKIKSSIDAAKFLRDSFGPRKGP